MKFNTNSNGYTFIFASVLVIIVAAALAFTAVTLQPLQEQNIKVEKMQNIMQSVGVETNVEEAEQKFNQIVTKKIIINTEGQEVPGDAFATNLKAEARKAPSERKLPVYYAKTENGEEKIIIPLQGKGLWGPVWGYLALNNDYNTIYGAVFDHKGETPGLGADINKSWFEENFKGKTLFEGDQFVSVTLYKGGKGAAKNAGDLKHGCDAISGGTITSKGVEKMMKKGWLSNYEVFLKKNRK